MKRVQKRIMGGWLYTALNKSTKNQRTSDGKRGIWNTEPCAGEDFNWEYISPNKDRPLGGHEKRESMEVEGTLGKTRREKGGLP